MYTIKPDLSPSKVVIFDQVGATILGKTVLTNIDHVILPARQEKIYLSIPIIIFVLKNIFFLTKRTGYFSNWKRRLGFIYFFSCIEYINPVVVLTLIDNSPLFHELSKHYKKGYFYTIQNGARDYKAVREHTMRLEIDNFFCFGQFENDLFSMYNHPVTNYIPVGSLKAGYYKTIKTNKNEEKKFTICCVSSFKKKIHCTPNTIYKRSKICTHNILSLLSKFINDFQIQNTCIACCSDTNIERKYLSDYFIETNVEMVPNQGFSTYKCMEQSEVIIVAMSTTGFEALGWGKKVLFCNFFGSSDFDYPLPSVCTINKAEYSLFSEKLKTLLEMDYEDYLKKYASYFKYFMNYDRARPAHMIIRNKILKAIG